MMSSMNTVTDSSYSDECGVKDLAAELQLEICSYLEVHDQLSAKRVCKLWRSILSPLFLSQYVDIDACKIPGQPFIQEKSCDQQAYEEQHDEQHLTVVEKRLEHALNRHIQKNTRIVVLRRVAFEGYMFSIVARIIKDKQANLIQLTFQDCEVDEEFAAASYWWLHPQGYVLPGLISVARKLILINYTMRNAFGRAVSKWFGDTMPTTLSLMQMILYNGMSKKLPITLPRYEFDRSKPILEHYHSFIMALDASCPEVSPEVRDDIMRLYNSWIHNDDIEEYQWQSLGAVIKCLNEGVPVAKEHLGVNVGALRQLDPRTLNKLTMEALHRLYYPSWDA